MSKSVSVQPTPVFYYIKQNGNIIVQAVIK